MARLLCSYAVSVSVKGTASNGMIFPDRQATCKGTIVTGKVVTSDVPLPNTVNFLNPLTINWQVSNDGWTTWFDAGTTDNRVYIVLKTPQYSNFPYLAESVLDIACRGGVAGKSAPNDVVDAVWANFVGPLPGVKRKPLNGFNKKDGAEMTYWPQGYQTPPNSTPGQLVSSTVGKCGGWAGLFGCALAAQGISVTVEGITPPQLGPAPPGTTLRYVPYGNSNNTQVPDNEIWVNTSHPGQGNNQHPVALPSDGPGLPEWFADHAVARVTDAAVTGVDSMTVYDSSYAQIFVKPDWAAAKIAWEDGSLVKCVTNYVDANNVIHHVTQYHVQGVLQTTWTP